MFKYGQKVLDSFDGVVGAIKNENHSSHEDQSISGIGLDIIASYCDSNGNLDLGRAIENSIWRAEHGT